MNISQPILNQVKAAILTSANCVNSEEKKQIFNGCDEETKSAIRDLTKPLVAQPQSEHDAFEYLDDLFLTFKYNFDSLTLKERELIAAIFIDE